MAVERPDISGWSSILSIFASVRLMKWGMTFSKSPAFGEVGNGLLKLGVGSNAHLVLYPLKKALALLLVRQ